MARPREFDTDQALDAAMEAFWERGYEATSMADLMLATGLQKGSLYKAFGSKHELYTEALTRYLSRAHGQMQEALETPDSARAGVERWLRLVLRLCDCEGRRGCFALNSTVELAGHDAVTAELLKAHFARVERLLSRTIARGQRQAEFRDDHSATELAEHLYVFTQGMLAGSRGGPSRARLRRSIAFALEMLS